MPCVTVRSFKAYEVGSNQVQEPACKRLWRILTAKLENKCVLVIPLYFFFQLLQFYWHRQPLCPKWSAGLNWIFLSSERSSLSLFLPVFLVPRAERRNSRTRDTLGNSVPPAETDLGSSPLHDECKQTILGRISAVRRCRQCTVSVYAKRGSLKVPEPDRGVWGVDVSHCKRLRCWRGSTRFAITHRLVSSSY